MPALLEPALGENEIDRVFHLAAQATVPAARDQERLRALPARTPLLARTNLPEPFPLSEDVDTRVLATPAWRGTDRFAELLADWQEATTSATSSCLYLLADPRIDGDHSELETRVLAAAAASHVDIDRYADIYMLMEPLRADRDTRVHIRITPTRRSARRVRTRALRLRGRQPRPRARNRRPGAPARARSASRAGDRLDAS